jgi:hypothetical protein
MFSNQKSNLGKLCTYGLGWKKVVSFCAHLDYVTTIWYILRPFGNLVAIWYIFRCFGIRNEEKSGSPVSDVKKNEGKSDKPLIIYSSLAPEKKFPGVENKLFVCLPKA